MTRLQMELAQLKKDMAAERDQPIAQLDMHADSVTPATTGALQLAPGDIHSLITSADSQHLAEMRSAILAPGLMISADSYIQPPPPPTADSVSPSAAGALVQPTAATRDAHSFALSAPAPADIQHAVPLSMTDYALPPVMPDRTVAAGPPRVPPRTHALLSYSLMYTVDRALPAAYDADIGRALPTTGSSQFLTMIVDRCDLPMPLYTAPSVVLAVTSVVPTAVHTSSLFSSGAYTQAPAGAFITHTSHGPVVSFPLDAYPGWGDAAIPMGYPSPAPALPTLVMGGPTASMVDPTSTLFGTLPTVSSLPTDTTSATTTAITNSAVDSVSSDLAPGLKFLVLALRFPGVATYPDKQVLPVPAATTPAVLLPTTTTPAAAQQPGSATTVPAAASTSTAASPAAPVQSQPRRR